MAVTSVQEAWESRTSNVDKDGVRTYTRTYIVQTDLSTDGAGVVREAAGIPKRGDVYATDYEIDLGVKCIEKEAKNDGEWPCKWMVEVKYSSSWADTAKTDENPLSRPVDESWGNAPFQEVIEKDIDDFIVANSAYERYDPPITRDANRLTLTLKKNIQAFAPDFYATYLNPCSVNDSGFWGFGAGKVKVKSITATKKYEGQTTYDEVTATFEINDAGWDAEILDAGMCELGSDGNPRPIMINGTPVSRPIPLNGLGDPLDFSLMDPVYNTHRIYPRKDFSLLGFGS